MNCESITIFPDRDWPPLYWCYCCYCPAAAAAGNRCWCLGPQKEVEWAKCELFRSHQPTKWHTSSLSSLFWMLFMFSYQQDLSLWASEKWHWKQLMWRWGRRVERPFFTKGCNNLFWWFIFPFDLGIVIWCILYAWECAFPFLMW